MVLVIGSSNTDLVISCSALPRPGETMSGGPLQRFAGGKGANQAVAAARAGARVAFIGARGDDELGKAAAAGLRAEGIDIRHFKVLPGLTSGTALILIGGKQRQNLIAVAQSANDAIQPAHLAGARALFRKARAVLAQLEIPLETVLEAARLAAQARIPFVLNPAPARKLPKKLLERVHTITPNEHESRLITGQSRPAAAAERLLEAGVQNVVITLGAKGAAIFRKGIAPARIAAPKVEPVDTVGAGDCFSGWLTAGLAEGLAIEDAARRAVAAASIAVTRPGAQAGMPRLEEITGGPAAA